jgi:D-glycero-alpha-D-manno-heptose-7-phosphate kinase
MIISRTPYRISFVGGGTDLRSFYMNEPGKVISTSIDKYLYVVVKRQIGIVEYKYRINWSKVEFKNEIDEIEHPIVREALKKLNINFPVEITTFADIPANTGLGSSSTFSVGLLHALYALKGEMVTKYKLAQEAAEIEIEILGRTMGKQDHFAAAYGNLNIFTFNSNETVNVEPVFYQEEIINQIQGNIILFYTNLKRDASEVLTSQNKATQSKFDVLCRMKNLVEPMSEIFSKGKNIHEFGEILHEGWELKKSLTENITNVEIEDYYTKARKAGAIGGKLLGAGGGGFLLIYAEKQNHDKIINSLNGLYNFQPKFDSGGTRITYYDKS